MEVIDLKVGPLETNCYLAFCSKTKEVIIIDPADSADLIIRKILDNNLKPKLSVATHGHFDHIMGALEIKLNLDIPFLINDKDLFLLKRTAQTVEHFLGFNPYKELVQWREAEKIVDGYLNSKDTLQIGKESFRVIETPGHSPGSVSLYNPRGLLFSGDTLFKDGVGRVDFSYASGEDLHKSLEKLSKLPQETKVYPGHGVPTTIADELPA